MVLCEALCVTHSGPLSGLVKGRIPKLPGPSIEDTEPHSPPPQPACYLQGGHLTVEGRLAVSGAGAGKGASGGGVGGESDRALGLEEVRLQQSL
jgi:hypothetical protein